MTDTEHWIERHHEALMNVFGAPQRVLVKGEGAYVWDAEGRRHLDLLAGIAVNALGHAHPAIVEAVTSQLGELGHVSNFFSTPPQVSLAEEILRIVTPGGAPSGSKVFFGNSGAEANEGALKLVRRHGGPERRRVLALDGAFHGRTYGAMSLTWKQAQREPFEPLVPQIDHVPFGDVAALEAALGDDVAALFIEPIQGEAGVRPLPPGYLAAARRLTSEAGVLLVLDEVQTGVGRTGEWMGHHLPAITGSEQVVPDVVTLAKGLGGGLPVGAVVALGEYTGTLLGPGQHGTTFGGNPVSAAAGLAVLRTVESEQLLAQVREVGAQLSAGLAELDGVIEVRGAGLLLAAELAAPHAKAAVAAMLDAGFIINAPTESALRFAPPLVLDSEQAATVIDALPAALRAAGVTT